VIGNRGSADLSQACFWRPPLPPSDGQRLRTWVEVRRSGTAAARIFALRDMSAAGHSRPGRASRKSGHVRYAPRLCENSKTRSATRTRRGKRCQSPAMANGRCRWPLTGRTEGQPECFQARSLYDRGNCATPGDFGADPGLSRFKVGELRSRPAHPSLSLPGPWTPSGT
jgi:hypothetical protein